jgi:hypothetical protein
MAFLDAGSSSSRYRARRSASTDELTVWTILSRTSGSATCRVADNLSVDVRSGAAIESAAEATRPRRP